MYDMFVAAVAEYRNLPEKKVRENQGGSNYAFNMQDYVDKLLTKDELMEVL